MALPMPALQAAGSILAGVLRSTDARFLDWDEVQQALGGGYTRGTAVRLTGNQQHDEVQIETDTIFRNGLPVGHWSNKHGWIRGTVAFTAEGFYIDEAHPQAAQRAGKATNPAAFAQVPDELLDDAASYAQLGAALGLGGMPSSAPPIGGSSRGARYSGATRGAARQEEGAEAVNRAYPVGLAVAVLAYFLLRRR